MGAEVPKFAHARMWSPFRGGMAAGASWPACASRAQHLVLFSTKEVSLDGKSLQPRGSQLANPKLM